MSHNINVKVAGIDGEMTEKSYEKCIGVLSFSHGISMPINRDHHNVSSPSGTAHHQDWTWTKYMDSTTPLWLTRVMGGSNIASALVTILQADTEKGEVIPLYTIEMKHLIVSSYSIGAAVSDRPVETISWVYHSIKFTYKKHKQVSPGGTPGDVPSGWDLTLNKPL